LFKRSIPDFHCPAVLSTTCTELDYECSKSLNASTITAVLAQYVLKTEHPIFTLSYLQIIG